MECRPLQIKILSGKDIKKVNHFTKMDVYAFVLISGDPRTKQKTPVDKDAGTSPKWNYSMSFTVDESALQNGHLTLVFQLRSERHLGDRDIGEVHVPLKELLDAVSPPPTTMKEKDVDGYAEDKDKEKEKEKEKEKNKERVVSYGVRTKEGKLKGTLDFSYTFGDKFTTSIAPAAAPPLAAVTKKVDGLEPAMAYPAAGYAGSSSAYPPPGGYPPPGAPGAGYHYPHPGGYPHPQAGYPPQQPGYGYPPNGGYGYPPQPGYGYPPQPGYGYAPQQPHKSGGSKFGLGLGAGLLGLGGLMVATDIAGDMAYDAGYDDAMDSMDF